MSNETASRAMTERQTNKIKIVVNGEERTAPAGQNIIGILAVLGLEADRLAVELNRSIVKKTDWNSTPVEDGASLEIVQFVGGG